MGPTTGGGYTVQVFEKLSSEVLFSSETEGVGQQSSGVGVGEVTDGGLEESPCFFLKYKML